MSTRELQPGEPGNEAASSVDAAASLAAIALPSIEPFGSDFPGLAGLPDCIDARLPRCAEGGAGPRSKAELARAVIESGVAALEQLRILESRIAGLKADHILRVCSAESVESKATGLHEWQSEWAIRGCLQEIAQALVIAPRTAMSIANCCHELGDHPITRGALESGELTWSHVRTIMGELLTVQETAPKLPHAQREAFERQLVMLAEETPAGRFTKKAAKAREKFIPESMETRVKEAFLSRSVTVEPDKNGMSWLILYVPSIAASAIMTHLTRQARDIKKQSREEHRQNPANGPQSPEEHRTLDHLRADIAAINLLGNNVNNGQAQVESEQPTVRSTDRTPADEDDEPPWAHSPGMLSEPLGTRNSGGNTGCPDPNQRSRGTTMPQPTNGRPEPNLDCINTAPPPLTGKLAGIHTNPITGFQVKFGTGLAGDDPYTPGSRPAAASEAEKVPDGTGFVNNMVDGIPENHRDQYFTLLDALARHQIIAEPPLPKALIILKVPFLGLLGITDEPAELSDSTEGPVPLSIARKLMAGSNTFLRVLTDPVTGEPLPLNPERYTLRDAERSVLQAICGGCYFPGCPRPVIDTELDHVRSFDSGGASTAENLKPACTVHHHLKHFKDDKKRNGMLRYWEEPWRQGIQLRGWTPQIEADGRVGWISPSGNYCPPEDKQPQLPSYPEWLKDIIDEHLHGDAD